MIIYFAPVRKRAHFTQLFFATQCERRACNRERRRGERDRRGYAAAALSAAVPLIAVPVVGFAALVGKFIHDIDVKHVGVRFPVNIDGIDGEFQFAVIFTAQKLFA